MSIGRMLFGLALLLALIATLTLPIRLQPLTPTGQPVLQSDGGAPPAPSPWVLPASTLAA